MHKPLIPCCYYYEPFNRILLHKKNFSDVFPNDYTW